MSPSRPIARLLFAALFFMLLVTPSRIHGDASPAVVRVTNEAALQEAVKNIQSNTTILIAPGVYQLSETLTIRGAVSNVTLRGDSENRDDVTLAGPGMTLPSYGLVPYGIATGAGVDGVTIANLSVRGVYFYAIAFGSGTLNPHVSNVHLVDAGAGFIAVNPMGETPIDDGVIEGSLLEYSLTADRSGANGIDIRGGENWLIRANVFRNIVGPSRQPAGAAVQAREHAIGTVTDGNMFSNCWQAIAYGMGGDTPSDHIGGIVRNNMISRTADQAGEAGIVVNSAPYAVIANNTVFLAGTYGTPIEYRFEDAHNLVLANNLLDGAIWARDGATGEESNNLTGARADFFADAKKGDLHLVATASAAIDRGVAMVASVADVDGQLRPSGSAYDIGADEYTPGGISGSALRSKATARTMVIAGRVTSSNGGGLSDVTVGAVRRAHGLRQDRRFGFFWFSDLPSGNDYVVAPNERGSVVHAGDAELHQCVRICSQRQLYETIVGDLWSSQVSLTSPANGSKFSAPASILMNADVSGGSGPVTKVEFYAGSTRIGVDTTGSNSITWSKVASGPTRSRRWSPPPAAAARNRRPPR